MNRRIVDFIFLGDQWRNIFVIIYGKEAHVELGRSKKNILFIYLLLVIALSFLENCASFVCVLSMWRKGLFFKGKDA